MVITYKYKLYRAKKNKRLHQTITLSGRAYNHCIALHKRYYRLTGKHLNQYALMQHLARLKKRPKYAWLKGIPSQALQDIVQRIEKGYSLFFKSVRGEIGMKVRPPTFKKSRKYSSFTLKQAGWKLFDDQRIQIGKSVYKFAQDREPMGRMKTVTIKRNRLGDLYVCLSQEVPEPEFKATTGKMAGFDFGLKTFLTVHDGFETYAIPSPQFFKQSLSDLKQVNRNLSRKQKGSHNRRKASYCTYFQNSGYFRATNLQ